jgi:hypothetical protein
VRCEKAWYVDKHSDRSLCDPNSVNIQFNPVTSTPRVSSGSLIPVNRSSDEGRRERSPSGPRALPPIPVPEPEAAGQLDEDHRSVTTSEGDEKGPLLGLPPPPSPEDDNRGSFEQFFAGIGHVLGIRVTQEALARSAKACMLAAKVVSHQFRHG